MWQELYFLFIRKTNINKKEFYLEELRFLGILRWSEMEAEDFKINLGIYSDMDSRLIAFP